MRLHVVHREKGNAPCGGEAFGHVEADGEAGWDAGAAGDGDKVWTTGGRGEMCDGFFDEGGEVGFVREDGYGGEDAAVLAVFGGEVFGEEEGGGGAGFGEDCDASVVAGGFDGEGGEVAGGGVYPWAGVEGCGVGWG